MTRPLNESSRKLSYRKWTTEELQRATDAWGILRAVIRDLDTASDDWTSNMYIDEEGRKHLPWPSDIEELIHQLAGAQTGLDLVISTFKDLWKLHSSKAPRRD